ncbi:MAG TPA: Rho termination factor N-terminal domain-containing protein, partial [Mycobacterium sp.]|nr:Rho termination factor N-terminal domain-containing protein [Mycobacterium sp.]
MTDTDLVTAGDSTENDKLSNPVTPETSSENDAPSIASDGSLATMVLPELRALANRSGVKGTSGMRKSELIAAIRETRQGGHANGASPSGGAAGESENNHDTKVANDHSESAVEDAPRTDSGERPPSGDNAGEQSNRNDNKKQRNANDKPARDQQDTKSDDRESDKDSDRSGDRQGSGGQQNRGGSNQNQNQQDDDGDGRGGRRGRR